MLSAATLALDETLELRLCDDIAKDIDTPDDIAARYGLVDEAGLRAYLRSRPKLVAHAKKLKALNESSMGAEDRARLKAVYASELLIAHVAHIAGDKAIGAATRIDAFKQLNRMAGMDGAGVAAKGAPGGPSGATPFSVTINIIGQAPETIIPTVVDADVIAAHEVLAPVTPDAPAP